MRVLRPSVAVSVLLLAACGGQRVRDFYTPAERVSVEFSRDGGVVPDGTGGGSGAGGGSGGGTGGSASGVVETGIQRLQVPCPGVVTPLPYTQPEVRCVNATSRTLAYEMVEDESCADITNPGQLFMPAHYDGTCQVTGGRPYKVTDTATSTALFLFRTTAATATLVVQ